MGTGVLRYLECRDEELPIELLCTPASSVSSRGSRESYLGPYLKCEVEAAIEVSRDVSVCTQCLQNGLQKQLPEGLQHPGGTPPR